MAPLAVQHGGQLNRRSEYDCVRLGRLNRQSILTVVRERVDIVQIQALNRQGFGRARRSSMDDDAMPASIEDVAKLANVSISTVSRVINRRKLVNEETCKRVEAAIRELRYRPNAFARGLMLRKSGIVGLVLPDLHGEFYSEIIRGANLQAREMGHNLLFSSALPGDDAESWLSAIGQHGLVDGLAVMVSDTMATGIGPTLAALESADRRAGR